MRAHRERLGISQEDYAEVLQVHRTYLGGIERGERNLTLRTVERLSPYGTANSLSRAGGQCEGSASVTFISTWADRST